MIIRLEAEADWPAIDRVNDEAFGGTDESTLVRRLRLSGDVLFGLVAEAAGSVVGHILFSRLPTEVDGRRPFAAALAPLAVEPAHQRRGVGSALVKAALATARERAVEAVIVLGHPDYYPRFGFRADIAAHILAPFAGRSFMALELLPGSLAGRAGRIDYSPPFGVETPRPDPAPSAFARP